MPNGADTATHTYQKGRMVPIHLEQPKNHTEVLRWHSGISCIKMDASMQ